MKVYEGKINLIGHGSWQNSSTLLSVLEIGNKTLKNINLSDYLRNYINPGENIKILVYKGILSHFVAGVDNNGKKYKWGFGKFCFAAILKSILFTLVFGYILSAFGYGGTALLLCFAFYAYQLKNFLDFIRF